MGIVFNVSKHFHASSPDGVLIQQFIDKMEMRGYTEASLDYRNHRFVDDTVQAMWSGFYMARQDTPLVQKGHFIVALKTDTGFPHCGARPRIHNRINVAIKEAQRLKSVGIGKDFFIYQMVGTLGEIEADSPRVKNSLNRLK
jgi:hypothetical protein